MTLLPTQGSEAVHKKPPLSNAVNALYKLLTYLLTMVSIIKVALCLEAHQFEIQFKINNNQLKYCKSVEVDCNDYQNKG